MAVALDGSVIPPRGLYHQLDLDDQVLRALAERGDDSSRNHAVEHHFYADAPEPLRKLAALGAKLGFRPDEIIEKEHEGRTYHHFNLVSHTPLSIPTMYRESLLMMLLSESHGVGYDGWGTLIAK